MTNIEKHIIKDVNVGQRDTCKWSLLRFFSGRRKKERNEEKNFYYHTNHLGSTAYVTDQNQNITQGFLYAPFGEITTEYAPMWQNGPLPKYAFNAKELDEETGMYYYEARYYKPPVFTSRDAMFEKYFWMTPYAYCANNPVKYVDPDGEEYVGIDGEKVEVKQDKDGRISVGENSFDDLKRMASLINSSGSKTAAKQFMKLSENECKIHFQIVQGNENLLGLHQAHNENGKPLEWNAKQGVFSEIPGFANNTTYKEATITIFEDTVSKNKSQMGNYRGQSLTLENAMVAVFAHEAEHNLNKIDILSIKNAILRCVCNPRDVERNAIRVENKTVNEILYAR